MPPESEWKTRKARIDPRLKSPGLNVALTKSPLAAEFISLFHNSEVA